MVAITFLFGVGVVAGLTWFKILRPFAKVLELSDEVNEFGPASGMIASPAPGRETADLIPLMTALNTNRGASVSSTKPAVEEVTTAPARRP